MLAQEAVPDKANELAAIPPLLERLGAEDGLKGALVSIDAIATNADIAEAITGQGADYLLAVKANQPTLRAEVEAAFAEAGDALETHADLDKGHGRIEERRIAVLREVDWLDGERRFPGELRLPGAACLVRAETRVESRGATRTETRYFISSRALTATEAADGGARALGDREPPPLGARRHLRRRPVPPPQGTRRAKHGHRPPLRPQPRPHRHRQAIHQIQEKARRMGPRLSQQHPVTLVTWIGALRIPQTCTSHRQSDLLYFSVPANPLDVASML